MRRLVFAGLAVLVCAASATGQQDTAGIRGVNWFAYPYAFYTPETNLAFGAAGVIYFRTEADRILNPSQVLLSGYYTINNQYDLTLTPQLYFTRNRYYASVDLGFRKIIDKFFGTGNDSPDRGDEAYTASSIRAELMFQMPSVFLTFFNLVGVIYRYNYYTIVDPQANPYLLSDGTAGAQGGASSGLGLIWVVDTRDNIYAPDRGVYHQFRAVFYSRALGGRFDYNDYRVDLRAFFPIFERTVVGLQGYANLVRGYPPFYKLARLGGSERMRGYYEGRFRDRNYVTGQLEVRQKIWDRIGLVGFLGAGQVQDRTRLLGLGEFKPSAGFGVRYVIDLKEKINVRADFAWGTQTDGIYFGINHAF